MHGQNKELPLAILARIARVCNPKEIGASAAISYKVKIIDSAYYGVDTFMMCEMNPYVLITQAVYADIHPNLITIPLETNYVLPYGLIYSNAPTPATRKFIEEARLVI